MSTRQFKVIDPQTGAFFVTTEAALAVNAAIHFGQEWYWELDDSGAVEWVWFMEREGNEIVSRRVRFDQLSCSGDHSPDSSGSH